MWVVYTREYNGKLLPKRVRIMHLEVCTNYSEDDRSYYVSGIDYTSDMHTFGSEMTYVEAVQLYNNIVKTGRVVSNAKLA